MPQPHLKAKDRDKFKGIIYEYLFMYIIPFNDIDHQKILYATPKVVCCTLGRAQRTINFLNQSFPSIIIPQNGGTGEIRTHDL